MQKVSGAVVAEAYANYQRVTLARHTVAVSFYFIVWVGLPWTISFYIAFDKVKDTIWVTDRCYNRLQGLASQNTHAFVAATNLKWQSRFGRIKFQILAHTFSALTLFMLSAVFVCKRIADTIKGAVWWNL